MTDRHAVPPLTSPYGKGGVPWWAALLVGIVVMVPSTTVLAMPAAFTSGPAEVLAMGMFLLGTLGVVGATFNSVLCKPYGWWPLPAALLLQWATAAALYPIVW